MSLAQSYARALYEAAKDNGAKTEVLEHAIHAVSAAVHQSKDLHDLMNSPAVSEKDRGKVLVALSEKAAPSATAEQKLLGNFLGLLSKKGRIQILPDVASAFTKTKVESEGGILGHVSSADSLKQEDLEGVAKAFGAKLGKKVTFQATVDPTLLAGMKVTVGGVTYDGTLQNQLSRLKHNLIHGNTTSH